MTMANRLCNCDCISGMKQLAAGSVDLAFADPPFNIGYAYDVYHDKLESDRILPGVTTGSAKSCEY